MGRKAKITKEMVLDAAYQLLEEAGIGAVGIKPIAEKLGCSTQPVSWLFGSMTELKKELFFYAGKLLFSGMAEAVQEKDAVKAFFNTGICYISLACDHPNVFRFVSVDDPKTTVGEDLMNGASIFSSQFNSDAVDVLASQFSVPKALIGKTVQDIVIYTHGLSVMMMFDSFKMPKEKACHMIYDVGRTLLSNIGIEAPEESDLFAGK